MKPYKIIISGGGTGGHLYPALAIADEFQSRHNTAEILFVGALGRIEMDKVPKSGYRSNSLSRWSLPFENRTKDFQTAEVFRLAFLDLNSALINPSSLPV